MMVASRITDATVSPSGHSLLVTTPDGVLVWSNFEIADMNFWRGEAYSKFFDYLDATGGFYYEVRTSLHSSNLRC